MAIWKFEEKKKTENQLSTLEGSGGASVVFISATQTSTREM